MTMPRSRSRLRRNCLTKITDPSVIASLCVIQRQFVAEWNRLERIGGYEPFCHQNHNLPGDAIYGYLPCGAAFYIGPPNGDRTRIEFRAVRGWEHWHDGWSFCRNELTPADVRNVVVVGCMDDFTAWFNANHRGLQQEPQPTSSDMKG